MPWLPALLMSKPAGLTPGFQPTIVPSSVANMNSAGAVAATPLRSKPEILNCCVAAPVLKTAPVGVPFGFRASAGAGTLTTRGTMLTGAPPPMLYSVETPWLLSATQIGEPDDSATPQGFTRCGSRTNG